MTTLTVKQGIDYVCESAPDNPISFARICAQVAIKAGELDEAVVWKQVIVSIQDEMKKEIMRPLVDNGPDDDSSPVF